MLFLSSAQSRQFSYRHKTEQQQQKKIIFKMKTCNTFVHSECIAGRTCCVGIHRLLIHTVRAVLYVKTGKGQQKHQQQLHLYHTHSTFVFSPSLPVFLFALSVCLFCFFHSLIASNVWWLFFLAAPTTKCVLYLHTFILGECVPVDQAALLLPFQIWRVFRLWHFQLLAIILLRLNYVDVRADVGFWMFWCSCFVCVHFYCVSANNFFCTTYYYFPSLLFFASYVFRLLFKTMKS